MQLPGRETAWSVNLDLDIQGASGVRSHNLHTVIRHACASNLTMARAGAPWVMQRIQSAREIVASRRSPSRLRLSHLPKVEDLGVLHQTVKTMAKASQKFEDLTTLVRPITYHS